MPGVLPGDYVEQAEHTCPATCAGLAKVGEVLEVVGSNVAVDGELAATCQSSSTRPLKNDRNLPSERANIRAAMERRLQ